ncbi:MAG: glycosyltransferase [Ruminococcaceae bacterium]|nr:glycosyltransferase [Oscillospiraceae bacterium]
MDQNKKIQKQLKKKRKQELRAYFREISQKQGFFAAVKRTLKYMKRRTGGKKGRYLPKPLELAQHREADILGWPRISVCVPVYNTTRQFFDELLASVAKQSYSNWELCILNASDDPQVVRELLSRYDDERIQCVDAENAGISANCNRAARMASGHYLVFLDHDDLLSPNALFEVAKRVARTEAPFIYSDEALFKNSMAHPTVAHFKPDYSPQYLLNCNYIAHLAAIRTDVFNKVGGFRSEFDGSQDHDLFLRVLEETGGAEHIPKVLYYWREHEESTSTGVEAKPYVAEAAKKAIDEHLQRIGVLGDAVDGLFPSTYKVNYGIKGRPLVSIIIPNNEHVIDLDRCIRSIYANTQYRPFEVLVVENNSRTVETFSYYEKFTRTYPECRVLIYDEEKQFNFSRICNFGRKHARGDYLLFLNNDTEVITPGWLGEMLQLCQLQDVAVVGAKLYYPDDTVQHAGVITGLGGYAGHSHKYAMRGRSGYMFRLACVQELSAVTGACMMVQKKAFDEVGGFDTGFAVAYNDVDLCLRLRRRGKWVLFTPYAELYHHESKSRGTDEEGEAADRFAHEKELLYDRYGDELRRDPFYNPNLTADREDFSESDVLSE